MAISLSSASLSDTDGEADPLGDDVLLIGRRGGPAFLASELARVEHLARLALSIAS